MRPKTKILDPPLLLFRSNCQTSYFCAPFFLSCGQVYACFVSIFSFQLWIPYLLWFYCFYLTKEFMHIVAPIILLPPLPQSRVHPLMDHYSFQMVKSIFLCASFFHYEGKVQTFMIPFSFLSVETLLIFTSFFLHGLVCTLLWLMGQSLCLTNEIPIVQATVWVLTE